MITSPLLSNVHRRAMITLVSSLRTKAMESVLKFWAPAPGTGGGTFFKVGGTSVRQKNYSKFLWFEMAIVTSQALKYDAITYTPYEGLNYTILDKIAPLWKRIGEPSEIQIGWYRGDPGHQRHRAHHTIYSDWIKPSERPFRERSCATLQCWTTVCPPCQNDSCAKLLRFTKLLRWPLVPDR